MNWQQTVESNRPGSKTVAPPPLFRQRFEHAKLDVLAKSTRSKYYPDGMRAADHKALLLYQLREAMKMAPEILLVAQLQKQREAPAETPTTTAVKNDVAQLRELIGQYIKYSETSHPQTLPRGAKDRVDWYSQLHSKLKSLTDVAYKASGPVALGEAWRRTDAKPITFANRPALAHMAEMSHAYHLADHLAQRLRKIHSPKALDGDKPLSYEQRRLATIGAIDQFRRAGGDFNQLRRVPPNLRQEIQTMERRLSELKGKPDAYWCSICADIDSAVEAFTDFYHRENAHRDHVPGGKEFQRYGQLIQSYRNDRANAGAMATTIEGQNPALDVIYAARWAKLAHSLTKSMEFHHNLFSRHDMPACPDSDVVKAIIGRIDPKTLQQNGAGAKASAVTQSSSNPPKAPARFGR